MTEPRKPGRPRKAAMDVGDVDRMVATPTPPPGPHRLEIRFNDKIVCLQRVHDYKIDQQDDKLTVTGVLKVSNE